MSRGKNHAVHSTNREALHTNAEGEQVLTAMAAVAAVQRSSVCLLTVLPETAQLLRAFFLLAFVFFFIFVFAYLTTTVPELLIYQRFSMNASVRRFTRRLDLASCGPRLTHWRLMKHLIISPMAGRLSMKWLTVTCCS